MGKKQAARKRKSRPPGSPLRVSSEPDEEETLRAAATTVTEPITSSEKPSPFQRVWSKESELTLLNLILQFEEQREKGTDRPVDSRKGLNAFIIESLGGQFTKAQVSDKVKRLKRKFSGISHAQFSSFSPATHHERKIFELSAKIWGQSGGAVASHHDMQPKRRRNSRMVDDDIDSKAQADVTAVDSDLRSREKRVRKSDLKEDSVPNSKEDPVPNSNLKEGPVPNSNSKEGPEPNSNSKEGPEPNSNSKEGPELNSNSKEGPVPNSTLEFEKLDLGAVSDLLGRAVESLGQVGTDERIKRLKKEIQVAELELFLKKGELLKRQLIRILESSGKSFHVSFVYKLNIYYLFLAKC